MNALNVKKGDLLRTLNVEQNIPVTLDGGEDFYPATDATALVEKVWYEGDILYTTLVHLPGGERSHWPDYCLERHWVVVEVSDA